MSFVKNDSNTLGILRLIAVFGTIAAALVNIFSVNRIEPNQHYSFYALAIVAVGVGVSLFVFLPQTAAKVWKNPDLLVPIGLYVTVDQLAGYFVQIPSFFFLTTRGFDFTGFTFTIVLLWIFQIVVGVSFVGWMTRTILQFVRGGKVDIIASFRDFQSWFPRTLAVMIFGWLPLLLLIPIILLPFLSGGSRGILDASILFLIVLIGVFSLIWNLATVLVLPYVLLVKTNLTRAIAIGMRLSWRNKHRTILPVVLLMLVSGWIIFTTVTYTSYDNEKAEFGETSSYTSETTTSNWNFSTNFVWVGDYQESSKWHESLVKAVKQKPLDSVDFRIMLLMLFLSLVVNLKIIETAWSKNLEAGDGVQINPSFGIATVILLVIFLMPLEYLKQTALSTGGNAPNPNDLIVPKIYTGENLFTKKEFFKIGWHDTTGLRQKDTPEHILPLGRIVNFSIFGKDPNIVVAGSDNALILDGQGNLKEKIRFQLGIDRDNLRTSYMNVEIVDAEEDGFPEFAGETINPNAAFLLDSKGAVLFKHKGEKIEVNSVAVQDLDADGKKEILVEFDGTLKVFDLKGKLKWSQDISTSRYGNSLDFLDTNGDGKSEIVVDEYMSGKIIEPKTENVQKIKKPIQQHGFLYGDAPLILFFDQNALGLFDFKGNLKAKYDAPLSHIEDTRLFKREDDLISKFASVFKAKAVRFKLKANEPEYLAVLATLATKPNIRFVDMLYIYDAGGNLVYQESLNDGDGQIRAFPNENGSESLLILEKETIWLYTGN